MTIFCKDCKYFQKPNYEYYAGRCSKITDGITIEISAGWDGGVVKYIEVNDDFSCIFATPLDK